MYNLLSVYETDLLDCCEVLYVAVFILIDILHNGFVESCELTCILSALILYGNRRSLKFGKALSDITQGKAKKRSCLWQMTSVKVFMKFVVLSFQNYVLYFKHHVLCHIVINLQIIKSNLCYKMIR